MNAPSKIEKVNKSTSERVRMGQCPCKRNVDWNGGRMGEEEHHDRPPPYLVATSAPEFEDDEQSVGNANCCHYGGSRFRPRIDGPIEQAISQNTTPISAKGIETFLPSNFRAPLHRIP
jgi:hypothetical protein